MNYNHLNQVHDYWRNDIFPHLVHKYSVASFDDYLRKFSFLPSGKWIRDLEKVKVARIPFAVIPTEFVKKYKPFCLTYNTTAKPEEGFQRAVYQISPTLHFEVAFFIWIEHKLVQSYAMLFVCYHDEKEYLEFVDNLYKIRREGDTEDKPLPAGFAGLSPALVPPLSQWNVKEK